MYRLRFRVEEIGKQEERVFISRFIKSSRKVDRGRTGTVNGARTRFFNEASIEETRNQQFYCNKNFVVIKISL